MTDPEEIHSIHDLMRTLFEQRSEDRLTPTQRKFFEILKDGTFAAKAIKEAAEASVTFMNSSVPLGAAMSLYAAAIESGVERLQSVRARALAFTEVEEEEVNLGTATPETD